MISPKFIYSFTTFPNEPLVADTEPESGQNTGGGQKFLLWTVKQSFHFCVSLYDYLPR